MPYVMQHKTTDVRIIINCDLRMWYHAVMVCFNVLSCNDLEGVKKKHTHTHTNKNYEKWSHHIGDLVNVTTNKVWGNHTGL